MAILEKLKRVSRRSPCPVCEKPDWCSTSEDGAVAICQRVQEGALKETRNGGWLHILRESDEWQAHTKPTKLKISPQPIAAEPNPAPIARRHAVYTTLLESLTLSEKNADDLLQRGLHDTFIANNLFATVPSRENAKSISTKLTEQFDLAGVPGFFRDDGRWQLNVGSWNAGYFIPVRDLAGRIQALQIRQDDGDCRYTWLSSKDKPNGATSGAPLHFAAPHRLKKRNVIVTEGALKAEVIAQFTSESVVALAGVTSFKLSLGQALRKAGIRTVRVAYDADWQDKVPVRSALGRLGNCLQEAGLSVSLLSWSPAEAKGLDDLLVKEVV